MLIGLFGIMKIKAITPSMAQFDVFNFLILEMKSLALLKNYQDLKLW